MNMCTYIYHCNHLSSIYMYHVCIFTHTTCISELCMIEWERFRTEELWIFIHISEDSTIHSCYLRRENTSTYSGSWWFNRWVDGLQKTQEAPDSEIEEWCQRTQVKVGKLIGLGGGDIPNRLLNDEHVHPMTLNAAKGKSPDLLSTWRLLFASKKLLIANYVPDYYGTVL